MGYYPRSQLFTGKQQLIKMNAAALNDSLNNQN